MVFGSHQILVHLWGKDYRTSVYSEIEAFLISQANGKHLMQSDTLQKYTIVIGLMPQ